VAPAPETAAEAAPAEPILRLTATTFAELPGWPQGQQGGALVAFLRSCARIGRYPDDRSVGRRTEVAGRARHWRRVCALAESIDGRDHPGARRFFEANFTPMLAANHEDPVGRFTGYYEASLRGSRRRHGRFQTPLYRRPKDLVMVDVRDFASAPTPRRIGGRVENGRLLPYASRAEIVGGALARRGLELVWVDDAIDAFFVQIQGSGVVRLDDGGTMRIGYAGQNGHVYTAIGRELIAEGALTHESVSMQSIRAWLLANPERADEMMNRNASYVFFEELEGDGPVGSQGVVLTPERSLAIDREFIAQTTPIWVDTMAPVPGRESEAPWRRLVIAQDTGGAIRGPVRGDIYWGSGERAADVAGRTKGLGRYYLLLPNDLVGETRSRPIP